MNILDKFDESWIKGFGKVALENRLDIVAAEVRQSRTHHEVHPPEGEGTMFNAFQETPLKDVKVVILGQDPYHDGSFNGLAFGNGTGLDYSPNAIGRSLEDEPYKAPKISPSLRNVKKGVEANFSGELDESLYTWAKQGVLLINTAHTVIAKTPGSHLDIWEGFTHMVLQAVNTKPNVVWMLWGKHAQAFENQVLNDTHHVIKSGHPSPLNTHNPFTGDCFVECNRVLKEMGVGGIKWTGE